ncbi:unnamed protein product, partial [Cyprideis torosa]
IEEAVGLLRDIEGTIEADPALLVETENRLGQYHSLARKHRIEPETIYAYWQNMIKDLGELEHGEENIEALEEQLKATKKLYLTAAENLSKKRQKAALSMCKKITDTMQELGMTGGQFKVAFETAEEPAWKSHGTDLIEFQVAANPGQPAGNIAKVASGGELSRISLAIQLLASDHSNLPTMIFDEVDTGIGGGIAEVVGQKLRALGNKAQVLCVTHLPQVAAQGHQHLQVNKSKSDKTTQTRIDRLNEQQKIDEIALVVLMATLGLARWSFEKGFLDYVNALEQGRLEAVALSLSAEYVRANRSWSTMDGRQFESILKENVPRLSGNDEEGPHRPPPPRHPEPDN